MTLIYLVLTSGEKISAEWKLNDSLERISKEIGVPAFKLEYEDCDGDIITIRKSFELKEAVNSRYFLFDVVPIDPECCMAFESVTPVGNPVPKESLSRETSEKLEKEIETLNNNLRKSEERNKQLASQNERCINHQRELEETCKEQTSKIKEKDQRIAFLEEQLTESKDDVMELQLTILDLRSNLAKFEMKLNSEEKPAIPETKEMNITNPPRGNENESKSPAMKSGSSKSPARKSGSSKSHVSKSGSPKSPTRKSGSPKSPAMKAGSVKSKDTNKPIASKPVGMKKNELKKEKGITTITTIDSDEADVVPVMMSNPILDHGIRTNTFMPPQVEEVDSMIQAELVVTPGKSEDSESESDGGAFCSDDSDDDVEVKENDDDNNLNQDKFKEELSENESESDGGAFCSDDSDDDVEEKEVDDDNNLKEDKSKEELNDVLTELAAQENEDNEDDESSDDENVDMEEVIRAGKAKEAERLAKEEAHKLEAERLAKEEADREKAERLAKEEADRKEAERLAKEEADKLEAERLAKEEADKLEAERLAKEEADKREADRLEAERKTKEHADKLEADRREAERLAKEEADKREADRLKAERLANEKRRKDEEIIQRQIEEKKREEKAKKEQEERELKEMKETTNNLQKAMQQREDALNRARKPLEYSFESGDEPKSVMKKQSFTNTLKIKNVSDVTINKLTLNPSRKSRQYFKKYEYTESIEGGATVEIPLQFIGDKQASSKVKPVKLDVEGQFIETPEGLEKNTFKVINVSFDMKVTNKTVISQPKSNESAPNLSFGLPQMSMSKPGKPDNGQSGPSSLSPFGTSQKPFEIKADSMKQKDANVKEEKVEPYVPMMDRTMVENSKKAMNPLLSNMNMKTPGNNKTLPKIIPNNARDLWKQKQDQKQDKETKGQFSPSFEKGNNGNGRKVIGRGVPLKQTGHQQNQHQQKPQKQEPQKKPTQQRNPHLGGSFSGRKDMNIMDTFLSSSAASVGSSFPSSSSASSASAPEPPQSDVRAPIPDSRGPLNDWGTQQYQPPQNQYQQQQQPSPYQQQQQQPPPYQRNQYQQPPYQQPQSYQQQPPQQRQPQRPYMGGESDNMFGPAPSVVPPPTSSAMPPMMPVIPGSYSNPNERYTQEQDSLKFMGFTDRAKNFKLLNLHGGDVNIVAMKLSCADDAFGNLKDMYPAVPEYLIKIALRQVDGDADLAAGILCDEGRLEMLKQQNVSQYQ